MRISINEQEGTLKLSQAEYVRKVLQRFSMGDAKSAFWYKKRILAEVLILLLEIISIVLDKIGGSNRLFLVASFLLSAIGFVTTIYTSFFRSTVPTVTRSESERQLIAVEIVFSFILLVFTYIQLIRVFLGAKSNNNNNDSLLPLAFAVISVVFIFRNNEEAQADSHSASVSQIISTETPAIVDGSVITQVPSTLHQPIVATTSTQSNNEEAQAVSDSESVSPIVSPVTPASVDESATLSQRRTSTQSNNQLHNIERKNTKWQLKKEMIKGAKAVRETAKLRMMTTKFRKEMIKGAKLVSETTKFRKR
ncbi:hypothetical protein EZV62_014066 [Acer yangbiense]|uniref:Reverse transcriptase Ty1/copia-type domain-containing protein n=1 Tax=Acer yangbiense TaxID=1000413 RepID=A0A5C7HR29_9ROSI|nr:hypothetical protein EZV62_014066 [Acer yangbiense]